jgi:deoxyribonuclease IV
MIRIGPAGIPSNPEEGLSILHDKGLTAAEIPFTHRIWMDNQRAAALSKLNTFGISLSIHAPYYVNLASTDRGIVERSMQRILDSCDRAHHMHATHVVFHPGYRGKSDPYDAIRDRVLEMVDAAKGLKVLLAPETAGKQSLFGTVEELLRLKDETGCAMCVDFAHLYAQSLGKVSWKDVFDSISAEKHLHCHVSGMRFGQKGELGHEDLEPAFFRPIAEEMIKQGHDATIISESPVPMDGALTVKSVFQSLKAIPI